MTSPSVAERALTGVTREGVRWVRSIGLPREPKPEVAWIHLSSAASQELDKVWDGTSKTGLGPCEFLQAVADQNSADAASQKKLLEIKEESAESGSPSFSTPSSSKSSGSTPSGVIDLLFMSDSEPEDADIKERLGDKVLLASKNKRAREAEAKQRAERKAAKLVVKQKERRLHELSAGAAKWLQKPTLQLG